MNRKTIDRKVKQALNHPLSDIEIKGMLGGRTKIVKYSDIHRMNSIDELLVPFRSCFILYEVRENSGHWVVLLMLPDGSIEFFDSYGGTPDSQLTFIPKNFASRSYQNYPYLSMLLKKSGKHITYNPYQFQKFDNNVKSCGRWDVLRVKLIDLPLEDFKKLFLGKNYDDIVTVLTDNNII